MVFYVTPSGVGFLHEIDDRDSWLVMVMVMAFGPHYPVPLLYYSNSINTVALSTCAQPFNRHRPRKSLVTTRYHTTLGRQQWCKHQLHPVSLRIVIGLTLESSTDWVARVLLGSLSHDKYIERKQTQLYRVLQRESSAQTPLAGALTGTAHAASTQR